MNTPKQIVQRVVPDGGESAVGEAIAALAMIEAWRTAAREVCVYCAAGKELEYSKFRGWNHPDSTISCVAGGIHNYTRRLDPTHGEKA